jgi:hypothetical protein
MKNSTKIVLVALAAIVLVSAVLVVIAPAVHAGSATPVLSEPYPRYPWAASCTPISPGTPLAYTLSCTVEVPPRYEVVIQTISITGPSLANPYPPILGSVTTTTGGQSALWQGSPPTGPLPLVGGSIAEWSASTTLYGDPGTLITCTLVFPGYTFTAGKDYEASCNLSGYSIRTQDHE